MLLLRAHLISDQIVAVLIMLIDELMMHYLMREQMKIAMSWMKIAVKIAMSSHFRINWTSLPLLGALRRPEIRARPTQ
jgi:hypothetical protein